LLHFTVHDRERRPRHFFLRVVQRDQQTLIGGRQIAVDVAHVVRAHGVGQRHQRGAVIAADAMRQKLRIQLEDVAADDLDAARHIVLAIDGHVRERLEFVFFEELFDRELRQLDAQHRVSLRRDPHHVQRLAAKRHQHPAVLGHAQRRPVLLQQRRDPRLMKMRAPFAPALQPEFRVHA